MRNKPSSMLRRTSPIRSSPWRRPGARPVIGSIVGGIRLRVYGDTSATPDGCVAGAGMVFQDAVRFRKEKLERSNRLGLSGGPAVLVSQTILRPQVDRLRLPAHCFDVMPLSASRSVRFSAPMRHGCDQVLSIGR